MTGGTTIYALTDPTTGLIHYIGRTRDCRHRLDGHVIEAQRGHACYRCDWIRSLGEAWPRLRPLMVVMDDEASEMERRAIALYRAKGCRLTNITVGGNGNAVVADDLRVTRLTERLARAHAQTQARAARAAAAAEREAAMVSRDADRARHAAAWHAARHDRATVKAETRHERATAKAETRAARRALAGVPPDTPEMMRELRESARILGRLGGLAGGRTRSPAKAAAARLNGALGGRPRKLRAKAAAR